MNTKAFAALAASVSLAVLTAMSAHANQIPGELVTGPVTSISGTEWINVGGHNYRIKSGSAAAAAVASLSPGQLVDVQLNGPAAAAASEVINVVRHSGK